MFKFVGFLLLALCLTGSFGEDPEVVTTGDPFGNASDLIIKVDPEPAGNTTTSPDTTTAEPVTNDTTTAEPVTNDTTTAPVTTTSMAPETTIEPVTTSSTVSPTPLPSPMPGVWNVYDSELNITCIRAKFAVQFEIFYHGEESEYNLSPNATWEGKSSCSIPYVNNTQVLFLEDNGYTLNLTFEHDSKSVYVQTITLDMPNGGSFIGNETYFKVKDGKSYLCNSKSVIKLENATLTFTDVHLQAFMHDEKDFSTAEDCATDDKLNDIVPISVACALCLMVVIILIGYLVTRRQSRQRGYQSV